MRDEVHKVFQVRRLVLKEYSSKTEKDGLICPVGPEH
jgi:hypothetical protein